MSLGFLTVYLSKHFSCDSLLMNTSEGFAAHWRFRLANATICAKSTTRTYVPFVAKKCFALSALLMTESNFPP